MHVYRLFLCSRDFSVALFFYLWISAVYFGWGDYFSLCRLQLIDSMAPAHFQIWQEKLQHKFVSVFKIENTNGFKLEYFIETLRFTSNLF